MSNRSRVWAFGAAGLLVVAGIAGAVAFSGTLGQVLALVLISLGFVLAIALVFLEVGLSEDRERARENTRSAATNQRSSEPRDRRALDRMRGGRRRLR